MLAPSDALAGKNFNGYGTCNALESNPDPDSSCIEGDAFGGVFIAKRKDNVAYKLCATYKSDRDCHSKRTDKADDPSPIRLFRPSGQVQGTWQLQWKVKGHGVVDTAVLHVADEGVSYPLAAGLRACGSFDFDPFVVRVKATGLRCGRARHVMEKLFNGNRPKGWDCDGPQTGYAVCERGDKKIVARF
jgi:hypothetical protein